MSFSVSTRSWSPTAAPCGRIEPSRTPRGSRAPAARHVQEPSGAELVSSISMRIGHGLPPYRVPPDHSGPYARMRAAAVRLPSAPCRSTPSATRCPTSTPAPTSTPTRWSSARCTIGPESSVWPSAVLRGDDGEIRIGARTSIQDGSVLHTTAERPDGRRRRVRDRPPRPPRGLHHRGPGDGRQRGDRAAPLRRRHRRRSSPPTPSCSTTSTSRPARSPSARRRRSSPAGPARTTSSTASRATSTAAAASATTLRRID